MAEDLAHITFPLHSSPGSIPIWITFQHVWHWYMSAALPFLSQRIGGRGVSVLNYNSFCIILDLKRRLYLLRIQQELKTLFEMENNIQEEFKYKELNRRLSSFITQWV